MFRRVSLQGAPKAPAPPDTVLAIRQFLLIVSTKNNLRTWKAGCGGLLWGGRR